MIKLFLSKHLVLVTSELLNIEPTFFIFINGSTNNNFITSKNKTPLSLTDLKSFDVLENLKSWFYVYFNGNKNEYSIFKTEYSIIIFSHSIYTYK